MKDNSELKEGENHPLAHSAFAYIKNYLINNNSHVLLIESFASTALAGNRTAEICLGTLKRILAGLPVGERYVMGLAWMLRDIEEKV